MLQQQHTAQIWAQYQKKKKNSNLLNISQFSAQFPEAVSEFRSRPPGAGLDSHFRFLDTCRPDLLKLPCSPSTSSHRPRASQTQLIHIGSDRREVWALRWSPSQPGLVSPKSEALPASPEPTVTHIPPSSLCLIFVGVWTHFQGAKRLVKVCLAVHVHAITVWILTFYIISVLLDAGYILSRAVKVTLCQRLIFVGMK